MHALLEIRGIGKAFPGVVALDGVDFTVGPGEIHALLGENGAGKSTLIKVLTGVHAPDRGEMLLAGRPIRPSSPKDAEELGISTVYQEINLVRSLSVAENITLGRQPRRAGLIDWRAVRRRAREALDRLEIDCPVDAELGTLSVAVQQMVAIARALDCSARLLILDEPTASLDEREVGELFARLRRLRSEGLGIVFVTHFLDQVYALTDRITVLRNGRLVGAYATAALPRLDLVAAMLGRPVGAAEVEARADHPAPAPRPETILTARHLGRRGGVEGIEFSLRAGEIVGLAGLLGSGRTETARLLFGIDRADLGEVSVAGRPARLSHPSQAVRLGLAFCSENRKEEGILPHLSVRENLIVALQGKRGALRPLARSTQESLCAHYIRTLRIKTPTPETPIRNLSGGNQQKVLLARWLATQPQAIILDEPTRGIDVGAKQEIEQLIAQLRDDGLAVLFISSEIEEVVRNCGRAIVLRERRQAGEVAGADLNGGTLMRLMAGTPAAAGEVPP